MQVPLHVQRAPIQVLLGQCGAGACSVGTLCVISTAQVSLRAQVFLAHVVFMESGIHTDSDGILRATAVLLPVYRQVVPAKALPVQCGVSADSTGTLRAINTMQVPAQVQVFTAQVLLGACVFRTGLRMFCVA